MLERSGWVPKVPQLTGKDVIDDKCGGTKICVIAALPHILDSGKAGRYALSVCMLLPSIIVSFALGSHITWSFTSMYLSSVFVHFFGHHVVCHW